MQFLTIREYFYKSYSTVLLIVLLPVLSFIPLYLSPPGVYEIPSEVTLSVFAIVTGMIWSGIILLSNKKIKSIRNRQGLREKLDKYFVLTIVRYLSLLGAGVLLAAGFYFYRSDFFTCCFGFQQLLNIFYWPSPSRVCSDLRLRGDERVMVYHVTDEL